jgi:hypothetical protein
VKAKRNPGALLLSRGFFSLNHSLLSKRRGWNGFVTAAYLSVALSLLPVASGTGAVTAASAATETFTVAETSSRDKGLDFGLLLRRKDL